MHNLLQFLNIVESMATLTAWVSVFGLLVDDGKSICGEGTMRTKLSFCQHGNLPQSTLWISMSDLLKISIDMSGWSVYIDYQHEECEIIVDYVFTHSTFTNSIDIDPFQVIIMDENHATVRCPLHRSR